MVCNSIISIFNNLNKTYIVLDKLVKLQLFEYIIFIDK